MKSHTMNKNIAWMFVFAFVSLSARAQTERVDTTLNIAEVKVTGHTTIHKVDRTLLMPTAEERKNSYTPYELLMKMAIPNLRVDIMKKELKAFGQDVQLRINGIIATSTEVAAILPRDILRIEMIDHPGKRYGDEELGAVIDIIVKRRESGGEINAQLRNSPNVFFGDNFLSAKFNHGRSQWGIDYCINYRAVKHMHADMDEMFLLGGKTIHRVQEGIDDRMRYTYQDLGLFYNYMLPERFTLNIAMRNNIRNAPHDNDRKSRIYNAATPHLQTFSIVKDHPSHYTPSLDVYLQYLPTKQQTITVDLVGTIIRSRSRRSYKEYVLPQSPLADITTRVKGLKHSFTGEAIYDLTLPSKAVFSTGIRHYQAFAHNEYTGSNTALSEMNQSRSSAFAELRGNLGKVSYTASAGLTRSFFKEGGERHTYTLFTPTLRISFAPHKNGYLNYRFTTNPVIPELSSLTNVEQAIDTIMIQRGNPNLRTYSVYDNSINYTFNKGKVSAALYMRHIYRKNCIMEQLFEERGHIVMMDDNQRSLQSLSFWPEFTLRGLDLFGIKNFLTLGLEGGFSRYWSHGNDYYHTYNSTYLSCSVTMMYKEFSLMLKQSTRNSWLYGETIRKGENISVAVFTWNHKRLSLGIGVFFPFVNNYRTGSERLAKVASSTSWNYLKEAGNLFVLTFGYNIEFGKKYNAKKKRIENSDRESGVLKVGN